MTKKGKKKGAPGANTTQRPPTPVAPMPTTTAPGSDPPKAPPRPAPKLTAKGIIANLASDICSEMPPGPDKFKRYANILRTLKNSDLVSTCDGISRQRNNFRGLDALHKLFKEMEKAMVPENAMSSTHKLLKALDTKLHSFNSDWLASLLKNNDKNQSGQEDWDAARVMLKMLPLFNPNPPNFNPNQEMEEKLETWFVLEVGEETPAKKNGDRLRRSVGDMPLTDETKRELQKRELKNGVLTDETERELKNEVETAQAALTKAWVQQFLAKSAAIRWRNCNPEAVDKEKEKLDVEASFEADSQRADTEKTHRTREKDFETYKAVRAGEAARLELNVLRCQKAWVASIFIALWDLFGSNASVTPVEAVDGGDMLSVARAVVDQAFNTPRFIGLRQCTPFSNAQWKSIQDLCVAIRMVAPDILTHPYVLGAPLVQTSAACNHTEATDKAEYRAVEGGADRAVASKGSALDGFFF